MKYNLHSPTNSSKFESITQVVEEHLLEALLIDEDILRYVHLGDFNSDLLFVGLELHYLNNLTDTAAYLLLINIFGELALLQLGQGQDIFHVEFEDFRRALSDVQTVGRLLKDVTRFLLAYVIEFVCNVTYFVN
eukprot:CAMPEP_0170510370 /NCGR_PEP_ID=MMETSP0208-20121228/65729_1 /TAXON_ID=197538 /ORGANISM="Strombidium inclinatum, Strain S3" /LENGTH=133 /DNA_ID=CAMNT_0010793825 /DNA_START=932 /DNA_END=1333 /DNA_ORIENTATION=-